MDERKSWIFGPFELLPGKHLLSRDGSPVAISPKPLAMLVLLIEQRDAVVSRNELLGAVWPGVTVSDSAFLSVLRDLRRVLGDDPKATRYIATERGRGLRFVAPVYRLPDAGRLPDTPAPSEVWVRAAINLERALRSLEAVEELRGPVDAEGSATRSRGELLVALGRARWAAGQPESARGAFQEARDLARTSHDFTTLAGAALGYVGRTDAPLEVNQEAVALLEEAIRAVPEDRTRLRAELLARLGTELYYGPDPLRPAALVEDAVALAEASGDRQCLAYALTALHYVRSRPEIDPNTRLQISQRVLDLVGEGRATDVAALALQERAYDLLELGDGAALRDTHRRYAALAGSLALPYFEWMAEALGGQLALFGGDVEEAERRAQATLERGRRIDSPNAVPMFAAQLFAVRREQDRLGELVPLIEAEAAKHPDAAIFRCGLPIALLRANRRDDARAALAAEVERGVHRVPRDLHWSACIGLLAAAAAEVGSAAAIAELEVLLRPLEGRMIPMAYGAATLGAVSHALGLLAAARGAPEEARAHLAAGRSQHALLGAALWVARSEDALLAIGS